MTETETKPTGAEMIAAERRRQVEEEGWTAEHDDEHFDDELRMAATCYLFAIRGGSPVVPAPWPWSDGAWKPSDDPVRNLVKAGALIAAEIDRRQRAQGADQ